MSVIAAAVLVAGLLTAWWVFSARPRQLAVRSAAAAGTGQAAPGQPRGSAAGAAQVAPGDAPGATSGGGAAASGSAATLVVDVAGKVRRPGVYELTSGARVVDALRAAGGAKPGVSTTALNLAAPLQDGEQVLVGVRGAAPAAGAGTAGGSAGSAGPVALNSATLEQLEALPGIGPVLAQHILDWRSQHGSFTSVQQLNEVSGIGPAKFAQLRDLVTP